MTIRNSLRRVRRVTIVRTGPAIVQVVETVAPKREPNPEFRAFTIRVPVETYNTIKERAKRRGVPLNYEANETLSLGLDTRTLSGQMVAKHLL